MFSRALVRKRFCDCEDLVDMALAGEREGGREGGREEGRGEGREGERESVLNN